MSAPFDWTEIKGIRYTFEKHTMHKYRDCHSSLNFLTSDIELPPSIFLDPEKTEIARDFAARIKDAIVEEIISILTDEAPDFYNNDNEHIASLFKNSILVYQDTTRGSVPLRSTSSFITAASQTIDNDKDYIEVLLNTSNWHFDLEKWTEMNFEYVSLREFQAETPQNNPTTNTNQDQTAAMTAFTNKIVQMQLQQQEIAQILTQNSNPNPSSFVNPGVYPTTTETSLLNPQHSEGSPAKNCCNSDLSINLNILKGSMSHCC